MNGVSIAQLIDVSTHHNVSVPAELGGCIVLAAADQLVLRPQELIPSQLVLFEDGILRVSGGTSSDETTAEGRLRELLGSLLRGARAPTPALLRAARRSPVGDLLAFVRELEIALVPTNRGAAKRALARLCRDVSRVTQSQPEPEVDPRCGAELSPQDSDAGQANQDKRVIVESARSAELPDIPDLEVPSSIVQSFDDSSDVVESPECVNSFWAYLPTDATESDPDFFELADADLLDDMESVQCPEADVDIACSAEEVIDADFATEGPPETTEPFPLTRVVTVAETVPVDSVRIARAKVSSVRHAILRFGPRDLDSTALEVATAVKWGDDLSNEFGSTMGIAAPLSHDTDSPEVQNPLSAKSAGVTSTDPSSEVRLPVSGPHHFIARPCFAKKSSKVVERLSQFGQDSHPETLDLIDRLHGIVSSSTARTGELYTGTRAEGGLASDRRLESEHDLSASRAHSSG